MPSLPGLLAAYGEGFPWDGGGDALPPRVEGGMPSLLLLAAGG